MLALLIVNLFQPLVAGNVNGSGKHRFLKFKHSQNDYLKTGTVHEKTPMVELIPEPVLELKTSMRNLLIVTKYEKVHNRCN